MFDQIDRAYYRMRAAEEREKALATANLEISGLHRRMAEEYQSRADDRSLDDESGTKIQHDSRIAIRG